MNFQAKQDKLFFKKNDELKKLYKERQLILERYDREIEELCTEQQKILEAKYVNREDSFNAIAYLVSQIEDVEYSILKLPIQLFINKDKPYGISYTIICLVKKGKELVAKKEICDKFTPNRSSVEGYFSKDLYDINDKLEFPSDNYIQLACYKPILDGNNIFYGNDVIFNISDLPNYQLETKIVDDRYSYIIDYMDTVVNYKLDKDNFEVTFDEMKILADVFVVNYKSVRCFEKKKILK